MKRLLQYACWLVLAALVALGLSRIHFDTEVLNLLPDSVPEVAGLKIYQAHFTNNRELIITVRGATAAAAATATEVIAGHLRSQTNLVERVTSQPPWQEHPEQLAELVACLWLNQPPEQFAALTNRLAPARLDAAFADAREQLATSMSPMALGRLGYDPLGLTEVPGQNALSRAAGGTEGDGFSFEDGLLRVIYVDAPETSGSYIAVRKWFRQVQSEVAVALSDLDDAVAPEVRYTGAPAFVAEVSAGMEHDMRNSVLMSLVIVAGLFWWAHRSWRPLLWLGVFLAVILVGTLGVGGLIWGQVNAVSTGFAAILLGLAVDYALVLYQESVASPHHSKAELRRMLAPSIGWSALTTACAFGLLLFAGLPGLAQLASMIAAGIILAALVMLYGFLPAVLRRGPQSTMPAPAPAAPGSARRKPVFTVAVSIVVAITAAAVWLGKGSRVDHASGAMQPRHCEAQIALDELQREMNQQGQPVMLVVGGSDERSVAERLDRLEARLQGAMQDGGIRGFELSTGLWPHVDRARTNLAAAIAFAGDYPLMQAAAERAGFTPDALALTGSILSWWQAHANATTPIWPTNRSSQWLLSRTAAHSSESWFSAGMVVVDDPQALPDALQNLHAEDPLIWVTGWPQLAEALLQHIENRLGWLVAAMLTLVTLCLWLAFRRWTEVLLSFAALGLSLLLLLGLMAVAGWSWNLMSLMAIPLLLGAGVDYTIHIQLALRRHQGHLRAVRGITGRAVLLCAATTITGFGSNAFSSNAGLASLGLVCATGIALVYVSAAIFLPAWWVCWHTPGAADASRLTGQPSSIYQPQLWRAALTLVRWLPASLAEWLGRISVSTYAWLNPRRRLVVEQNLLPWCGNDVSQAQQTARRLFANFGGKLVQLWRSEAGVTVGENMSRWSGWEILTAAQQSGRGVLLVTPHLGDWELGGYMLARRGVHLLVLTQPEPGAGFTELRQRSRARSGIDTLVVGQDAFAFVEVIKHLQSGAVVALLVDRPVPSTAVTVELCGRPFQASVAAAELARASGCVVLPVYVVHDKQGAEAHVMPEIVYDRRQLGNREARRQMTQQILRVFEPAIQAHADQWYHFVPVWPEANS